MRWVYHFEVIKLVFTLYYQNLTKYCQFFQWYVIGKCSQLISSLLIWIIFIGERNWVIKSLSCWLGFKEFLIWTTCSWVAVLNSFGITFSVIYGFELWSESLKWNENITATLFSSEDHRKKWAWASVPRPVQVGFCLHSIVLHEVYIWCSSVVLNMVLQALWGAKSSRNVLWW